MALKQYNYLGFDKYGYNREGFDKLGYNREGYDRNGYDRNGFNKAGIHKLTGRDVDGFDIDGYDADGFDRNGFNRDGYDANGYNRDGFNRDGYNVNGYNRAGFNRDGYDVDGYDRNGFDWNGYDRNGYNKDGFDCNGMNRNGYDCEGFDKNGYNRDGFDRNGYNKDGFNALGYDREGFNQKGFDIHGYDRSGYNRDGFDKDGFDKSGYNKEGFNRNGYDIYGFNIDGIDENGFDLFGWSTNTQLNILGYDVEGFNSLGVSIDGYSRNQFDEDGYHLLTGFNLSGYDRSGFNINGIDRDGYYRDGFNCFTGLNKNGYDREGYNTKGFDVHGFNRAGFNKNGFDADGYNIHGFNADGFDRDGWDIDGFNARGYNLYGYNRKGEYDPESTIPEFKGISSIDETIERQHLLDCINFIRKQKNNEFEERKARDYRDKKLHFYDDCELQRIAKVEDPMIHQLKRIIDRKYEERLNQPYMARVAYSADKNLYLGKTSIDNWVVDWADKRAQYYYQYQIYIGDKTVGLTLVRNFQIVNGKYIKHEDLYNAVSLHDKESVAQVADSRLHKIMEANRANKRVHDIIESIQRNQYDIITEHKEKNILVNSCAGSGKTMILMHRIRYIKYNNPEIDMNSVIVISPTNVLEKESRQLAEILQLNNIRQYDTIRFYDYCIIDCLKHFEIIYEPLTYNSDAFLDKKEYTYDRLQKLKNELRKICENNSEKKKYLDDEYDLLNKERNLLKEMLQAMDDGEFKQKVNDYRSGIKEMELYRKDDITEFLKSLNKAVEKALQAQQLLEFLSMLCNLKVFNSEAHHRIRNLTDVYSKLRYTQILVGRLNVLDWLYAVQKESDVLNSLKDVLLSTQLYSKNALEKDLFYRVIKELNVLCEEDVQTCCQYLSELSNSAEHYECKIELLKKALQKDLFRGIKSKKQFNADKSLKNITNLYMQYMEVFEDDSQFFDIYTKSNLLLERMAALNADRKQDNGNAYLFYKILHTIKIPTDTYTLTASQAFQVLYLLNAKLVLYPVSNNTLQY